MLKLIVNADDFGLSEKVNSGIADAFSDGILRSTSLMAGGRAFDHAVSLAGRLPELGVGIHLTLVEEPAIADAHLVPSLLGENGRLHKSAGIFAARYAAGRIKGSEIRKELEAQILKVKAAGIDISHIDSHQHLHMLPGIFQTVLDLAGKHNIKAVRIPREKPAGHMWVHPEMLPRFIQMLVLNTCCKMAGPPPLVSPDRFVGFFYSGQLTVANLKKTLPHLPDHGTCELICHPGEKDPDSPYRHWGYAWEKELAALLDPEIADWIATRSISLCSYRDLAGHA